MPTIHPTAVVDPAAKLADGVEVGPFCVVGPEASLGEGTCLRAHVVVDGATTIGRECIFYPFSCVGSRTQDLKYRGGTPRLVIGDRTTVRESATLNTATHDGDETRVGSDCLLMAYTHVAHDCIIGDHVILANCATLAGHIEVEDHAIIGGLAGIHQFVRIGRHSIIGGCSKVTQDVPPFMMADGHPLEVRGLNSIGLKRHQVGMDVVKELKAAYRTLYREGLTTSQAVEKLAQEKPASEQVRYLLDFIAGSERGITR